MLLIRNSLIGTKYIGSQKAAERANVSRARFNQLRKEGKVPAPACIAKINGRRMTLYDIATLDVWIAEREPECVKNIYNLSPIMLEKRTRILAHAKNLYFVSTVQKVAKQRRTRCPSESDVVAHILHLRIPMEA
jgi:hypothetical protein